MVMFISLLMISIVLAFDGVGTVAEEEPTSLRGGIHDPCPGFVNDSIRKLLKQDGKKVQSSEWNKEGPGEEH